MTTNTVVCFYFPFFVSLINLIACNFLQEFPCNRRVPLVVSNFQPISEFLWPSLLFWLFKELTIVIKTKKRKRYTKTYTHRHRIFAFVHIEWNGKKHDSGNWKSVIICFLFPVLDAFMLLLCKQGYGYPVPASTRHVLSVHYADASTRSHLVC